VEKPYLGKRKKGGTRAENQPQKEMRKEGGYKIYDLPQKPVFRDKKRKKGSGRERGVKRGVKP